MITLPQYVDGISSIIDNYDFFLIDLHGVIHDGVNGFPEAVHSVNTLCKKKPVFFLSNNPRRHWVIQKKIQSFGVDSRIQVLTSGELVLNKLQKDLQIQNVFHCGSVGNTEFLIGDDLPVKVVSNLKEADAVVLTLNVQDVAEMEIYREEIEEISQSGLIVLCANPDKTAPHGNVNRICAGTFATLLEDKGVDVHYFGKPERNLYEYFLHCNPSLQGKRGLMIGDTLETDILFAKRACMDSLLVFSGISRQTQLTSLAYSLAPEFYSPMLRW